MGYHQHRRQLLYRRQFRRAAAGLYQPLGRTRGGLDAQIGVDGTFHFKFYHGWDAYLAGESCSQRLIENMCVAEGLENMADEYFAGSSYTAAFYFFLIEDTSWSAVADGDTLASHAGWTECTAYDEGSRQAAAFSAASSKVISTSAATTFTMSATKTLKGGGLCTVASGTSGTLFCAGTFTEGDQIVGDDDVVSVTWSGTMSDQ